jgi:hypothetical protein
MKKIKLCALGMGACLMLSGFTGCFNSNPTSPTGSAPETSADVSVTSDSTSAPSVSAEVVESSVASSESSDDNAVVIESSESSQNADNGDTDFDVGRQEYANTFLSNFAEQYFYDYERNDGSAERVLDFVHIYLKINSRDSVSYSKNGELTFETFTLEKAQSVAAKYFGLQLTDDQISSLSAPPTSYGDQPAGPFYADSKIWYEAGDGESYNSLAIVDSAVNNSDGTITLNFTVYALDLDTYWAVGNQGMTRYYKMTAEEAAKDKALTKSRTGTAVVGVAQSGNYYLISYKTVY